MEGIKYVNLIEIGPVVTKIKGFENGELVVPVNNKLVHHTAFLAAVCLDLYSYNTYYIPITSYRIVYEVILD